MSQTRLRWGILGTANINRQVVPAIMQSASSTAHAIAGRSLPRAQAAAQEFGIPHAYGSYEELLADPAVDAVYIPLPNHLHAPWVRAAADAGKHVLCEKPLTLTASEARELIDYCRAKNIRLMDGTFWPHHPRTAQMRQLLDAGRIGRVQRVNAVFTFNLPPDPGNIRLQPEMGGGSLLDVGWYCVYGIRWAMGAEPVRVWATAQYAYGVDMFMAGQLWFADDRTASFECGFTAPLRMWLEAVGTTGTLRVPHLWLADREAVYEVTSDGADAPEIMRGGPANQVVAMIDDFAAAVRAGREAVPSPEESYRNMRVLDALAQSARQERVVALD
jgi:xylose dehydrogenase (NAD/NADP)